MNEQKKTNFKQQQQQSRRRNKEEEEEKISYECAYNTRAVTEISERWIRSQRIHCALQSLVYARSIMARFSSVWIRTEPKMLMAIGMRLRKRFECKVQNEMNRRKGKMVQIARTDESKAISVISMRRRWTISHRGDYESTAFTRPFSQRNDAVLQKKFHVGIEWENDENYGRDYSMKPHRTFTFHGDHNRPFSQEQWTNLKMDRVKYEFWFVYFMCERSIMIIVRSRNRMWMTNNSRVVFQLEEWAHYQNVNRLSSTSDFIDDLERSSKTFAIHFAFKLKNYPNDCFWSSCFWCAKRRVRSIEVNWKLSVEPCCVCERDFWFTSNDSTVTN